MKFISLVMKNWLVFKNTQSIIFPQDDHANILVIFGENMHGKTSLLNAVRWALYGEALDRQKRSVPEEKLLNIGAKEEGDNTFGVRLLFEADGEKFEIDREVTIEPSRANKSVIMKRNNRVIDGGAVEPTIESLVPKQISQFLLFDGELLNQFEELVIDEGSSQANAIKNSIERALGLPVLQRAVQELEILKKGYSKQFQTEMKKNRNLAYIAKNLELHENNLNSKQEEKESIEAQIAENRERLSELDDILEKASRDINLGERKRMLTAESKKNITEIVTQKNRTKLEIANLWREPLARALSPHILTIKNRLIQLNRTRQTNAINYSKIKSLEKALLDNICSECGNPIEENKRELVQEKLDALKSGIEEAVGLDDKIAALLQKRDGITVNNESKGSSVTVKLMVQSVLKLERRNIEIDNELFEIRNELAGFDEEQGRHIKNEYDMRRTEIGKLGQQVISIESDIEAIQVEIAQLNKHPEFQSAKSKDSLASELELSEKLLSVFSSAVSNYRDSMRRKIGSRASETFGNLTTEKQFDELQINESYGLNLIIDGHQVSRSAGAEQIVALSLIEALNYHGRRKGPMLMDTPAGRLDRTHRKNVMNYLPKVVTQLAFFAHSGELTDDEVYFDRSRIGQKYIINRLSSFHSVLEAS